MIVMMMVMMVMMVMVMMVVVMMMVVATICICWMHLDDILQVVPGPRLRSEKCQIMTSTVTIEIILIIIMIIAIISIIKTWWSLW